MSEPIMGSCLNDANPDDWFPEQPNGGYPPVVLGNLAVKVRRAVNICNTCPKKDVCLEEGMKVNNLAHGIWGGLMPAQRIAIADEKGIEYSAPVGVAGYLRRDEKRNAIALSARLEPYLKG